MSLLRKLIYQLPAGPLREAALNRVYGKSIEETSLALQLLSSGPLPKVMIDVGSHFGNIMRPFAEAGWRVIAFEPDPANRRQLEATAAKFAGVSVDARAVADTNREDVPFFTSEESTGISSLSSFRTTHRSTYTVNVTTLAAALPAYDLPCIDLLKTDAEGHDLAVLKGFDWAQAPLPSCIICEYEDRKTRPLGYTLTDTVAFLEQRGYRCLVSEWYPIEQYGQRHRWRRFVDDPSEAAADSWGNVIAVLPDLYSDLLDLTKHV